MIYTLTLNPSIDYVVRLEGFQLGELNRTISEEKFPGGKGINVSRVLNQLGMKSKALGYIGGFTGAYIEQYLQKERIATDFVKVKEDTRINIKLKTGQESEINAKGPSITEHDLQLLMDQIRKLKGEDLIVLAGSIPATLPETIYEELVKICSEKGARFVVDAEGTLLKKILPYQPLLIKPNHHELGDLFHVTVSSPEEAIPYAKKLVQMGAKNVIVSLAAKGAILINENMSLRAEVPKGMVKNSVGAGDSMVAGFLAAYDRTSNIKEAFRYSVASGSATAFSMGLCSKDMVEELLPHVQIREI
ncbi:1-phosphofructokinase [Neobacillus sp.]|uniref:1-phosphofructokinase n=1 Tax=Neobacillus sp. TaxID=2675273 RepID=UPI0028990729|nr:1-phosphofructokinase [Neobacillus sp.]